MWVGTTHANTWFRVFNKLKLAQITIWVGTTHANTWFKVFNKLKLAQITICEQRQ